MSGKVSLVKSLGQKLEESNDEDTIKNVLQKLKSISINLQILKETKIGATVNKLTKTKKNLSPYIINLTQNLVKKWKNVANKQLLTEKNLQKYSTNMNKNEKNIKNNKHNKKNESLLPNNIEQILKQNDIKNKLKKNNNNNNIIKNNNSINRLKTRMIQNRYEPPIKRQKRFRVPLYKTKSKPIIYTNSNANKNIKTDTLRFDINTNNCNNNNNNKNFVKKRRKPNDVTKRDEGMNAPSLLGDNNGMYKENGINKVPSLQEMCYNIMTINASKIVKLPISLPNNIIIKIFGACLPKDLDVVYKNNPQLRCGLEYIYKKLTYEQKATYVKKDNHKSWFKAYHEYIYERQNRLKNIKQRIRNQRSIHNRTKKKIKTVSKSEIKAIKARTNSNNRNASIKIRQKNKSLREMRSFVQRRNKMLNHKTVLNNYNNNKSRYIKVQKKKLNPTQLSRQNVW